MQFTTNFQYHNRAQKAEYVWRKYQPLLRRSVLDVGADERHLASYLPAGARYWGIGLGGSPDQAIDLEMGPLPFSDSSFETVLCLDVLEHIDKVHNVFDELCRVAAKNVIISLPNAWAGILRVIMFGDYDSHHHMKFYGMPPEKPVDRHKWFLSYDEAVHFVTQRARQNHMKVIQVDPYYSIDISRPRNRLFRTLTYALLSLSKVNAENFFIGTMWVVLEKREPV